MLNFLPAPLLGSLSVSLLALNSLFWLFPFLSVAIAKLLIANPTWRRWCTNVLTWIAWRWVVLNNTFMDLLFRIDWQVSGLEDLDRNGQYIVISNHRSWLDVPVLMRVFHGRLAFPRFFMKQALIWVPVIGLAAWALDCPFMKRYSKEDLKKHPELRGRDLETTRLACERLKDMPISFMIYLEGTRFTSQKHARLESPYRHLLQPKAGGLAYILAALGDKFDTLINATVVYPDGEITFWDFLSGRLSRIIVNVEKMAIPQAYLEGDYIDDPVFRQEFQAWVRELWVEKDACIDQILLEANGSWQEQGALQS